MSALPNRRAHVAEALEARRLLSSAATVRLAPFGGDPNNGGVVFDTVTPVQDKLFLTGYRDGDHDKLWAIPAAGTSITPTPLFTSSTWPGDPNIGISAQTAYHNKFYFTANGLQNPTTAADGLFVSDGTAAGTVPVKFIRVGSANGLPTSLFVMNDKMFFLWNNGTTVDLWTSDGTAGGTVKVWTGPSGQNISSPSQVLNGDHVLFGGGPFMYRSDGTAVGTVLVSSGLGEAQSLPDTYTVAGSRVFFLENVDNSNTLWSCGLDGSNFTLVGVPSGGPGFPIIVNKNVIAVGNRVVYRSNYDGSQAMRIWSTDGTPEGTFQLAGGQTGAFVDQIGNVALAGPNKAVFSVSSDSATRAGRWSTDGTPAGTAKIGSGSVEDWVTLAGRAVIPISSDKGGLAYWQSDGTSAGTRRIDFVRADASTRIKTYIGSIGNRLISTGYLSGKPSVWSLDMDTPTGTFAGDAITDYNRNGTREAFEPLQTGTAYIDTNENGAFDYYEAQILFDGSSYKFSNLPPDQYVVRFKTYPTEEPANFPIGGAHVVNVLANTDLTGYRFALRPAGNIAWGVVFHDVNRNGVRDANETGLAGEVVHLDVDNNGLTGSDEPVTMTSSDGSYGFLDAAVGTYRARLIPKSGWINTTLTAGGNVSVPSGGVGTANPLGTAIAPGGHIDGTIWTDWNRDGVLDSGDTGANPARAYIDLNNNGVWNSPTEPSALTDANGVYHFTDVVPGSYTVRLNLQSSSYRQTVPAPGSGRPVTVTLGATSVLAPFMQYDLNAVSPGGRISGTVWSDANNNGVRDAGEQPAWGRTVWIDADGDGVLGVFDRRAVTDANGAYSFANSRDGDYTVKLALPAGWTQTSPAGGGSIQTSLGEGTQVTVPDFLAHSTDTTAPMISSTAFSIDPATGLLKLNLTFTENVFPTLAASDLDIANLSSGGSAVSDAITSMSYNTATNVATFAFAGTFADAYYLSQILGNRYRDEAGNAGAADIVRRFIWSHGTSAPDAYRLTRDVAATNVELYVGASATIPISAPLNALDAVYISSGAGADTINVELTHGSPMPGDGLIIDAGAQSAGGGDTLNMIGSTGADTITFAPTRVSVAAALRRGAPVAIDSSVNFSNVESVTFDGRNGGDAVTLSANATVTMLGSQRFASANIGSGARLNTIAGGASGSNLIQIAALSISPTGTLDLLDNDLLVPATPRITIENYVRAGYHFGDWLGAGGIVSSTARNNSTGNTTLGLLSGQEFNDNNGGAFDGYSPIANDVLVKYTYFGDVDFNGRIDASDYNLIDFGYTNHLTGWAWGDADYSAGPTDVSDYNLIDFAFATQSGLL